MNELNLEKELGGDVYFTCSKCKLDCESYDELTCKHHTIKEQCNDPIMNLNSKHQHQLKSSELVDLQLRKTPDPNTSEVTTNLPNYISVHTKVEFSIITKDGNGDHCSKGGHNVTVELKSSADHVTCLEVKDDHDGSYVALLEGKQAGGAELHQEYIIYIFSRAAPILVSVSVSGRYCCFHEVSESAIILLQIPILITCENKITFVCTCLFY